MSPQKTLSKGAKTESRVSKPLRRKVLTKSLDLPLAMSLETKSDAEPVLGGFGPILEGSESPVTEVDTVSTGGKEYNYWETSPTPSSPDMSPKGRVSMLVAPTKTRPGVEMDMATKAANELLLAGKEALETAGNMKRECKTCALDSLQAMYEIVLSVSDSRSRHRVNLEQEKFRHAKELLIIERAHTKQMAEILKRNSEEIKSARVDIKATLEESKAVRAWLGYETREPYEKISRMESAVARIDVAINNIAKPAPTPGGAAPGHPQNFEGLKEFQESLEMVKRGLRELSTQLDECRRMEARRSDDRKSNHGEIMTAIAEMNAGIEDCKTSMGVKLEDLRAEVKLQKYEREPEQPPFQPTAEIGEQLNPIMESVMAIRSELRTLRDRREKTPPVIASLQEELALAEGNVKSYATVARKSRAQDLPKPKAPPVKHRPTPNYTLIVSSKNPQNTGDQIIEEIREALDTRTTGAKVDKVRRARNQKVILKCGTKEDLKLVQQRMGQRKDLRTEVARAVNPLIIIRDVLAYHKDEEIIDNIKAQNKQIFQDLDEKEKTIRVKYRKRARNPLECHPVLEVSPKIHRKMLETEVVYIGLQRRPVADQSPVVQCGKCLGYGHTKAGCRSEKEYCSYCGGTHGWEKCTARKNGELPSCRNCVQSSAPTEESQHNAFSTDCREWCKWDAIARSKVAYC